MTTLINVTQAFREEVFIHDNRSYIYNIRITFQDETYIDITNEDLMEQGGVVIDEAVSTDEHIGLGSCVVNKLSITLKNYDGEYDEYDFRKANVVLKIGLVVNGQVEQFQRGIYIVAEPPVYNSSAVTITCYDYMMLMDKLYSEANISYPINISTLLDYLCTACGVRRVPQTLATDSMTLTGSPASDTTTCREILSHIAQMNGMFCRFDELGRLYFEWFANGSLDSETVVRQVQDGAVRTVQDNVVRISYMSNEGSVDWNNQVPIPAIYNMDMAKYDTVITGVRIVIQQNAADDTSTESTSVIDTYVSGTDDYLISVENNPLINASNAETILAILASRLIGLKYRKATVSHLGMPWLCAGDTAVVTDAKGLERDILVSSTVFTALDKQNTTSAGASPVTNTAASFTPETIQYVKTMEGIKPVIQSLGQRIANAGGLYETRVVDQQGATITYLHNKKNLSESDIQIKVSDVGVVVTSNGTSQSPTWYGLTVNGLLIASILRATGIDADWITTGRISAENGDTYFDLTRGYFAITSQNSLYRLVLRGWSAALIIQHRTSTDQDWNNSIEMGAQTTDTYEIGEIYASGAGPDGNVTAIAAFPVYYLGSYHNRKTFASVNSNGYSSVSANIMTAQNYDETDVRDGYCQVEPYSINFWQKDGTALKCYLSIQANVDNETSIAAPQGNLIIKALNDGVIDTQSDFKHSIAILDDEKLKRLCVWSNNVSFYTRANTSSEFTRDGYIYNNGTDLQISSEHGNLVLSGKLISAQSDFKHSIAILDDGNLKRLYVWSDNISFYTRANTSSGFTRKNNIYSNGTNLVLNSDSGKVLISHNNENVGPAIGGGSGSDLTKVLKQMYLSTSSGTTFAMFVPFSGSKTYYVTLATTSDERIKKNIKESKENALETIEKIKHVSFDFRENDVHRDNGYIAQQLEEVNPAFVSLMENPNGDDTYIVNQYEILTYATKAIQELSEKNRKLEERVEKLEKIIEKLANK